MSGRMAQIPAWVQSHRMAFAGVVVMGVKASGALLTLLVFTFAARAMTADDFGRLAIWFNMLGFLGIAATFGQDTLVARSFGEYAGKGDYRLAWGAYRYGWRMTIISAIVFAVGVVILGPFFFPSVARTAFLAAAMFLLTQTSLHYSSHATRVAVNFVVSEVNREITWRVVLLVVVIWSILHQGLTPTEFFAASAVGQLLSLAAQLTFTRGTYLRSPAVGQLSDEVKPEWAARAHSMWLSAAVEAASLYFDVMLIGYFASPAVAGDYFAATRIANIFQLVSGGVATYSFTHASNLYFSGQIEKLQDMLRSLALAVSMIITPLFMLIILFGDTILTIFGARYATVYPTLAMLSAGAFVMALSGTPSVLLLTTGHEQLYSRVITVSAVLRMALTSMLAVTFGPFGAACGWAIVNAPLTISLALICRAKLGVDPSIVSIFRGARPASTETVA